LVTLPEYRFAELFADLWRRAEKFERGSSENGGIDTISLFFLVTKPAYDAAPMSKNSSSGGYDKPFKSALKTGAERFLAQAIVHAFEEGFRTPDDFLRHFKPLDLMQGLEAAPELRTQILVAACGVHEKIARKKSTNSAAEDVRIALDEGVTDGADILNLFPPDDRVRYLDQRLLWVFLVEDEFWQPLNAEADVDRAVGRMTFLLETALGEDLLSLEDIVDGLTFDTISTRLPLRELQKLVKHALKLGRDKKPLTEDSLLDIVPLRQLVSHISLDHVWNTVILPRVAGPAGFLDGAARPKPARTEPSSDEAAPAANAKKNGKKPNPRPVAPEPIVHADSPALSDVPVEIPVDVPMDRDSLADEDVDKLVSAGRPPAEEEARRRVLERLTAINRLPPRHDTLPTPILLSIESMYAELLAATTDEQREMCIREAFPNQSQLTTALLALIELLDPSIDVNDPVIRDADVDSLIKVVLFEERHRYEQAHPSARPAQPSSSPLPPPAAARRPSAVPPPLPRASGGPPPLPPPPGDQKRAR
jgi:hypothetical protein